MSTPFDPAVPFLNVTQAAGYLLLRPSTLDRWRSTGGGPAFYKVGARVYYKRSDLDAWREERRRQSTAEHKAKRGNPPTFAQRLLTDPLKASRRIDPARRDVRRTTTEPREEE